MISSLSTTIKTHNVMLNEINYVKNNIKNSYKRKRVVVSGSVMLVGTGITRVEEKSQSFDGRESSSRSHTPFHARSR